MFEFSTSDHNCQSQGCLVPVVRGIPALLLDKSLGTAGHQERLSYCSFTQSSLEPLLPQRLWQESRREAEVLSPSCEDPTLFKSFAALGWEISIPWLPWKIPEELFRVQLKGVSR